MYGFGRGAAASDRDADQGDLCAATRMTRWWQRPNLPMSELHLGACLYVAQHDYSPQNRPSGWGKPGYS
jgi:hypothetical protein